VSYLPDPEHEGHGLLIGDIHNLDMEALADQVAADVRPRYPWCCSWPCDCAAYAVLGQRCEWDESVWISPNVEDVIPYNGQRELVRLEEGDRVAEHVERHQNAPWSGWRRRLKEDPGEPGAHP
jgi:hypothetical protein